MFHEKIEFRTAVQVSARRLNDPIELSDKQPAAKFWAFLIVCGLPFFLIYLLFRFLWSDLKALGRGLRLFQSVLAEELSRKP